MFITRSPLRISFSGGGSDFPSYYTHHQREGMVISTSINKYVYSFLKISHFIDQFILKYRHFEHTNRIDNIEHPFVREIVRKYGLPFLELTTTADIPSHTGLGSSSAFGLSFLRAVYQFLNIPFDPKKAAEELFYTENVVLKHEGGKQDEYISAYGGINVITFNKHAINVQKIELNHLEENDLCSRIILFYTGIQRSSHQIQSTLEVDTKKRFKILDEIVALTKVLKNDFSQKKFDSLGKILHETWILKRSLSQSVASNYLDQIYQCALSTGAEGGKILGAGGGGFFLFYVLPEKREALVKIMGDRFNLQEEKFCINTPGTQLLLAE